MIKLHICSGGKRLTEPDKVCTRTRTRPGRIRTRQGTRPCQLVNSLSGAGSRGEMGDEAADLLWRECPDKWLPENGLGEGDQVPFGQMPRFVPQAADSGARQCKSRT